MSYFLIASRDDIPRAYDVPATVNITTNVQLDLEPYLVSDPSYIVEKVMSTQTKNQILDTVRLMGLSVRNKSSKLEIATALATSLVAGLEYVEVKEDEPSSSGNIDNDTVVSKIDKLDKIDTLFITKWIVNKSRNETGECERVSATAEAMNKNELLEIIKGCENKTVEELNDLMYSLFLKDQTKALSLEGEDINLVKDGKKAHGHFHLAVQGMGLTLRLKVVYDNTTKGSDMIDVLVERYDLDKNAFEFKYGTGEGASVIRDFDCLCSYMAGETPTVYVMPKIKGGAKNQDVKNKIVRSVVGKTNIKKTELYKMVIQQFRGRYTPSSKLTTFDFVQEGIGKVGVFCQSSDVDAKKALIDTIAGLDLASLQGAFEATASSAGGTTEQKVKKMSTFLFGQPFADAMEAKTTIDGMLEGAELAILSAFFQAQEQGFKLADLREEIKNKMERKIGAEEASKMET